MSKWDKKAMDDLIKPVFLNGIIHPPEKKIPCNHNDWEYYSKGEYEGYVWKKCRKCGMIFEFDESED